MTNDTVMKLTDGEVRILAAAMRVYHADQIKQPVQATVEACQYFIDMAELQNRINEAFQDIENEKEFGA